MCVNLRDYFGERRVAGTKVGTKLKSQLGIRDWFLKIKIKSQHLWFSGKKKEKKKEPFRETIWRKSYKIITQAID